MVAAWGVDRVADHTARVELGEVLRVDDAVTGFDLNKPGRPCCVVKVESSPRSGAWVLPRSTKGTTGTFVPGGVLPGLDRDGRFQFIPRYVSAQDLENCPSLGVLPDPHRSRVLANVNTVEFDLE